MTDLSYAGAEFLAPPPSEPLAVAASSSSERMTTTRPCCAATAAASSPSRGRAGPSTKSEPCAPGSTAWLEHACMSETPGRQHRVRSVGADESEDRQRRRRAPCGDPPRRLDLAAGLARRDRHRRARRDRSLANGLLNVRTRELHPHTPASSRSTRCRSPSIPTPPNPAGGSRSSTSSGRTTRSRSRRCRRSSATSSPARRTSRRRSCSSGRSGPGRARSAAPSPGCSAHTTPPRRRSRPDDELRDLPADRQAARDHLRRPALLPRRQHDRRRATPLDQRRGHAHRRPQVPGAVDRPPADQVHDPHQRAPALRRCLRRARQPLHPPHPHEVVLRPRGPRPDKRAPSRSPRDLQLGPRRARPAPRPRPLPPARPPHERPSSTSKTSAPPSAPSSATPATSAPASRSGPTRSSNSGSSGAPTRAGPTRAPRPCSSRTYAPSSAVRPIRRRDGDGRRRAPAKASPSADNSPTDPGPARPTTDGAGRAGPRTEPTVTPAEQSSTGPDEIERLVTILRETYPASVEHCLVGRRRSRRRHRISTSMR